MVKRNTYWIAALSALLSLSLVLPYCCHVDISELLSNHQQAAAHSQHSDGQQCNCGHKLVKDYQKTKKVASSQTFSLSPAVLIPDRESFSISTDILPFPFIEPGVLRHTGPPLHLLNGVLLN